MSSSPKRLAVGIAIATAAILGAFWSTLFLEPGHPSTHVHAPIAGGALPTQGDLEERLPADQLTVSVRDRIARTPIEDAQISVFQLDESGGTRELIGVPNGQGRVTFPTAELGHAVRVFVVRDDYFYFVGQYGYREPQEVVIYLVPKAVLEIVVHDTYGEPVADAEVSLKKPRIALQYAASLAGSRKRQRIEVLVTNGEGVVEFAGVVPADDYVISVHAPRFPSQRLMSVSLVSGRQSIEVGLPTGACLVGALSAPFEHSYSVRIFDEGEERTLDGGVLFRPITEEARAVVSAGHFEVCGLRPGHKTLKIWRSVPGEIDFLWVEETDLRDEERRDCGVLTFSSTTTRLLVVSAEGTPLAGAKLEIGPPRVGDRRSRLVETFSCNERGALTVRGMSGLRAVSVPATKTLEGVSQWVNFEGDSSVTITVPEKVIVTAALVNAELLLEDEDNSTVWWTVLDEEGVVIAQRFGSIGQSFEASEVEDRFVLVRAGRYYAESARIIKGEATIDLYLELGSAVVGKVVAENPAGLLVGLFDPQALALRGWHAKPVLSVEVQKGGQVEMLGVPLGRTFEVIAFDYSGRRLEWTRIDTGSQPDVIDLGVL